MQLNVRLILTKRPDTFGCRASLLLFIKNRAGKTHFNCKQPHMGAASARLCPCSACKAPIRDAPLGCTGCTLAGMAARLLVWQPDCLQGNHACLHRQHGGMRPGTTRPRVADIAVTHSMPAFFAVHPLDGTLVPGWPLRTRSPLLLRRHLLHQRWLNLRSSCCGACNGACSGVCSGVCSLAFCAAGAAL